jgi:phosphoglycolate phosphatase-like HAD superfamily hydrolase
MYGKEQIVAMIGDSRVDAEFAENAGIKFYSTNELQDQPLYDDFEHICQEILRESIQNE